MSSELALFTVLCLVYVTDCFLWVGKHSLAFVTWFGKRWKDRTGGQVFKTDQGSLMMLNPFPPLGQAVCCHLPPLSISPMGICSINCQTFAHDRDPGDSVAVAMFAQIGSIGANDKDIWADGKRFCRCGDARQAASITTLLNALREGATNERQRLIEHFWGEQFDHGAAKARLEEAEQPVKQMRILCNVLFFLLFGLAPALVLYVGMTRMIIPLALAMFVMAIQISVGFYILHGKLYPAARADRISNLIKMITCPPAAIRACDLITHGLLSDYSPLVVAHLLLPPGRYREFAARTLRYLKYQPDAEHADWRIREITTWQNALFLRMASDYLKDAANLKEELLSPPVPNDPGVLAYCPRCLCQFMREEESCPDCPGVKLIPFSGPVPVPSESE